MVALQEAELGYQIELTGGDIADLAAFAESHTEQDMFREDAIPDAWLDGRRPGPHVSGADGGELMRALVVLCLVTLPGIAGAQSTTSEEARQAERGRELAVRWCSDCHVVARGEPGGDIGPAFPSLNDERTEPGLRAWLFQPHPPMPDLHLGAEEVDALMAYVRTLKE